MIPRGYLCYRTNEPIVIDGRLDKPCWRHAPWTEDFTDIEGDARPAPRHRTRARMLWDDDFLYIGAEMEEPHVWANITEHDAVIFQDNDFEIFIDPEGDNHDYYEIEINALNTEWDLRLVKPYRDNGPALNEWEIPGLKTAVHIDGTLNDPTDTDRGWSAELAIPWLVLREYANRPSPPRDGDQWRMNFSRVEWDVEIRDGRYHKIPDRPEHNWVWSPQGVVDMHRPEKWGYVQFSTAPAGQAVFVPDPTLAARDFLMEVYYAQRAHRKQRGAWAPDLETLGLTVPAGVNIAGSAEIRLSNDGYIASVRCALPDGTSRLLCIREDSRLSEAAPD